MSRLSGEIITSTYPENELTLAAYDSDVLSTNAFIPYISDSGGNSPYFPWQDHWSEADLFIFIGFFIAGSDVRYAPFVDSGTAVNLSPLPGPDPAGVYVYVNSISNAEITNTVAVEMRMKRVPVGAI